VGIIPAGSVSGQDDAKSPERDASHPARRAEGGRVELTDSVVFHLGERQVQGWALNLSRGGLRAVVEEPLAVGTDLEVALGEAPGRKLARVVWVKPQPDGAVVGVAFIGSPFDSIPPPPSSDPEGAAEP
jgi:hypothetical protein